MPEILRLAIPESNQPGDRMGSALCWIWLPAIALAPVWFGSNLPLVWDAHAVLFGLLLAAYGAERFVTRGTLPVPLAWLAFPLAALGIVLTWAAIQTIPWVPASWQHPVWAMVSSVLGNDVPETISIYPAAGRRAILSIATMAAVFFLGVQFGRDAARARIILLVLAVAGGAIAAYGLVVYGLGNHWVLWVPKHAYLKALTATFINRNNFAAYAGITLICALGLAIDDAMKLRDPAGPTDFPGRSNNNALQIGLLGILALVIVAALLLTGSRGGFVVTVLGLVVMLILQVMRLRTGRISVLIAFGSIALAIVFLTVSMGDFLISRLTTLDADLADRLAADARVLAAIKAAPLLGYGLGAFEQSFPMFIDAALDSHNRWEYAHNDWLEALMTLGIPAGLMLWSVFAWILARCVIGALTRAIDSIYPAIGTSACILMITDSLIDFSVQIQGFAIPLMTILGVAVAQSWSSRRPV